MELLDTLPAAEEDRRLAYRGANGLWAVCRLRVYRARKCPEFNGPDLKLLVLTELPENAGPSITTAAEQAFCAAWLQEWRPCPVLFVEHYPGVQGARDARDAAGLERLALVRFAVDAHEDLIVQHPRLGSLGEFVGPAGWTHLPMERFYALIGARKEAPSGTL